MTDSQKNPLVSIAILTWNRRVEVAKAIDSVYRQAYRPVEVVVVDSASDDGTGDMIRTSYPDVKYIRLHRNLGCPEGRNVALANCAGEFIYALDDDGWLAENTLEICVDRFLKHSNVGVVGCTILAPDEMPASNKADFIHYAFSGGASAIRRSVLDRAGYYPSDFYRQAEEGDLTLRILDKGFDILICPAAIMYHEPSATNRNEKLFTYYGARNELFTVIRRYPFRYLLPSIAQKIVAWNYYGFKHRSFRYSCAGTLSALFQLRRLISERSPVSTQAMRKVFDMKVMSRYSNVREDLAAVRPGGDN